jgi:uncharacterized membrane protein HdeD (DUF308 family)
MNQNTDATGTQMARLLGGNWKLLVLRGLLAIVFGILAFMWPGMTLIALVYLFGAYALVNGVIAFTIAARAPKGFPRFGGLIFEGIFSILAGIGAFLIPGITAFALLILIASWAIVTGIFEIVAAIRLRKVIENEWLLILAGILSTIFGVLLLMRPAAGAVAMVFWIAGFAIAFGILLIAAAFRVRRHPASGQTAAPTEAAA